MVSMLVGVFDAFVCILSVAVVYCVNYSVY